MSKGIDRAIAYKTMRAVQQEREEEALNTLPQRRPSLWMRWKAAVYRLSDRVL